MNFDDDFLLRDLNILSDNEFCRKVKTYKKRIDPFEFYSCSDFEELYRFDKRTARQIIEEIRPDLNHECQQGAHISPEIMVMATIRYIAKGSYQKDIGDIHGISQQSMTGIIRKVVTAIALRMRNHINFPLDRQSLQQFKTSFYRIAKFPQCIGAIDCTQIKIKNPGGELGGRHLCRKGFYSLNVQIICNAEYKIMDIVAGWRGSAHDSRIWRESRIKERLEQAELYGGVLLGDNGYACSNILLTPFRISANLSLPEQRYNRAQIKTRNTIEKLFGQLKNKFRCCFNGISVDLDTAKNMIVAIAVVFNISKQHSTLFSADLGETEVNVSNDNQPQIHQSVNTSGTASREEFINTYFS